MIPLDFTKIDRQTITAEWLPAANISLEVLRLDTLHPVVSGNKIYKLKYYLQDAVQQGYTTIATFGGAWSNHIVATAYVCQLAGLNSVGIIRGEEAPALSKTLQNAEQYGMKLIYVTREQYKNKEEVKQSFTKNNWYWINEGGYGIQGAKGAAEILTSVDLAKYTHIIAAVGTGTMLAGVIQSSLPGQQVIGVSSMKGNTSLHELVLGLIPGTSQKNFTILHDYHFGGYGNHPQSLIEFINQVYLQHNLPLDIVYTGKAFYAVKDLVQKQFFQPGSKLLIIHSGGLQGNSSLGDKVLTF